MLLCESEKHSWVQSLIKRLTGIISSKDCCELVIDADSEERESLRRINC